MRTQGDHIDTGQFDREYAIQELFPLPLAESLLTDMDRSWSVTILDADGARYYGPADERDYATFLNRHGQPDDPTVFSENDQRFALFDLVHELETIGFLVIHTEGDHPLGDHLLIAWGRFCARMITQMIHLHYRNLMTAGLHGQVVAESYATLKQKARQLAASEEKYRTLAERLEIEVEKKTRQIQKNQLHMLQQEKMAAIGQLAAGMAHEINNPVGFVISNLNTLRVTTRDSADLIGQYRELATMLTEKSTDGSAVRKIKEQLAAINRQVEEMDLDFILEDTGNLIDESLDGAKRVKIIVENLRDFTHPSIDTAENLDINDCLNTTLAILSGNVPPGVKISRHYAPLPNVSGRLREINQAFFNILKNALQAVGEQGTITIATTVEDNAVSVQIADTGPGIAQADLAKLFDPFFTTREVGSGIGLGLFHAYCIVRTHGGSLAVQSRPGEGAAFTVHLPMDGNSE
jgi:two-component system, NtrC family, sensor kinase